MQPSAASAAAMASGLHHSRANSKIIMFDLASPAMLGGELDIGFTFVRGPAGRMGMTLGFGAMSHPGSDRPRTVIVTPMSLFAAIRLGSSRSELMLRAGGTPAWVMQFGQSVMLGKAFAGFEFLFPFSARGSGVSLGADLYFPNGASIVPRVGFAW